MFDLLIRGGLFFGMTGDAPRPASIAVKDGKVSAILPPGADAMAADSENIFDAAGLYVCPGFVDIHMHDERFEDPDTVQRCLIAQGVTTAVAGNCGSGPLFEKSLAARPRPWLHLSYLVGNRAGLREEVGRTDRYTPAAPAEIAQMCSLLRESLQKGARGLSLGLEYAPGASWEEIDALAAVTAEFGRIVTVHIRYDDDRCVGAVREMIRLSKENGVRLQVSHLGSMTMGHTRECETLIEEAAAEGVDVGFDCYPYDAFCTAAGSAVYDDGFVERWKGKGPECLEAVSGRFRGSRLTFGTLAEMRREEPDGLIVAHVMDREEIENCVANPACIVASDALAASGGAHPRIAGTFPRALGILRRRGYGWEDALRKMTVMPADRMRLDAGRLYEGAAADITVFDPETFIDRATFQEPFTPPDGLKLVVIGGHVALKDKKFSGEPHGSLERAPGP
ncbi:MAG: amidohydrolase family protein [Synergistaceae bacterium]|jgi:N-acyl-D-amino-acid deacylase|nr:amidohydrolase family protein [Synergistaceae bacterium]